jgi:fermentation-respiration switch protein FrsA (DUF1100 family)
MIFLPHAPGYADSEQIIKLRSGDDRIISAVHLPNPNAHFTILYSHGNAEDLGDMMGHLTHYKQLGFSIFAYDYSGYGTSTGKATSRNACEDAEAAWKYLTEKAKIPPNSIILHGRSVGGGPAHYLAKKYPAAGLIADSNFVSAFRVLTRIPLLPFDKFRNLSRIDDINCPVLILHGTDDRTIPIWHGEALYKRAKAPKTFCKLIGATHNHMPPEAAAQYWAAIRDFAHQHQP